MHVFNYKCITNHFCFTTVCLFKEADVNYIYKRYLLQELEVRKADLQYTKLKIRKLELEIKKMEKEVSIQIKL